MNPTGPSGAPTSGAAAEQGPPPPPAPAPVPAAPAPEAPQARVPTPDQIQIAAELSILTQQLDAVAAAARVGAMPPPQRAAVLQALRMFNPQRYEAVQQRLALNAAAPAAAPGSLASLPPPAALQAVLPPGALSHAAKLIARNPAQQQILENALARQQQGPGAGAGAGAAVPPPGPPLLIARPASATSASAAAAPQSIPTVKIPLSLSGLLRRPAPAPGAALPLPLQPQPSGGLATSDSAAAGSLLAPTQATQSAAAPQAPPGPPPPPPAPPGPLFDPEYREVIHTAKMQWMAGVEGPHGAPLRALAATVTTSDVGTSRLRPPRTWWDSLTQGGAAGIHTRVRKEPAFSHVVLTLMAMPEAVAAAEAAADAAAANFAAEKKEDAVKEEVGAVGNGEAAAEAPAKPAAPAAAKLLAVKPEPSGAGAEALPAVAITPAAPQQPAPAPAPTPAPPVHAAPPLPLASLPSSAKTYYCSVRSYEKYPSEYYIQGAGVKALYRDLRMAPGDALRLVYLGMDPQGRGYPILAADRVPRAANPRAEAVLGRPHGPPRRGGGGPKEPKAKKPRVPRKPRALAGSRIGDAQAAPGGRKRKVKPTRADAGDGVPVFYDDAVDNAGSGGWAAGGGYNEDAGIGGRPRRAKSRLRRFDDEFVDDYETDAEADFLPSGGSTDDEGLYDGGYGVYDDVEMEPEGETEGVGGGGGVSGAGSPTRSLSGGGGGGGGSSMQNDPLDMLAGIAGEALDDSAAAPAPAPAAPAPAVAAPLPAPPPALPAFRPPLPPLPFRPGLPPMHPMLSTGAPRPFPLMPPTFRPPLPLGMPPAATPTTPSPPGPTSPPPPLTILSRKILRGDGGAVVGAKLRLHWERGTRTAGDVAAGLCAFGLREAAAADVDDFEVKPEECCAEVVVRLVEPGRLDVLESTVAKLLKECKG